MLPKTMCITRGRKENLLAAALERLSTFSARAHLNIRGKSSSISSCVLPCSQPLLPGTSAHLVDPVGVQDSQTAQLPPSALLGHRAQIPGRLQLRHALVHGLSVHNTLHMEQ